MDPPMRTLMRIQGSAHSNAATFVSPMCARQVLKGGRGPVHIIPSVLGRSAGGWAEGGRAGG
jgi:hypothetical protein